MCLVYLLNAVIRAVENFITLRGRSRYVYAKGRFVGGSKNQRRNLFYVFEAE